MENATEVLVGFGNPDVIAGPVFMPSTETEKAVVPAVNTIEDDVVLNCDLCKFTGNRMNFSLHLESVGHKNREAQWREMEEHRTMEKPAYPRQDFYCSDCQMEFNTLYQLREHVKAVGHACAEPQEDLRNGMFNKKDNYICGVCIQQFNGPVALSTHIQSEYHQKKLIESLDPNFRRGRDYRKGRMNKKAKGPSSLFGISPDPATLACYNPRYGTKFWYPGDPIPGNTNDSAGTSDGQLDNPHAFRNSRSSSYVVPPTLPHDNLFRPPLRPVPPFQPIQPLVPSQPLPPPLFSNNTARPQQPPLQRPSINTMSSYWNPQPQSHLQQPRPFLQSGSTKSPEVHDYNHGSKAVVFDYGHVQSRDSASAATGILGNPVEGNSGNKTVSINGIEKTSEENRDNVSFSGFSYFNPPANHPSQFKVESKGSFNLNYNLTDICVPNPDEIVIASEDESEIGSAALAIDKGKGTVQLLKAGKSEIAEDIASEDSLGEDLVDFDLEQGFSSGNNSITAANCVNLVDYSEDEDVASENEDELLSNVDVD